MAGIPVSPSALPSELWLYIHRLAVSDISLLAQDTDGQALSTADNSLNESDLQRFLEAAARLRLVCRRWSELAQELLYENIWVRDSLSPSLGSALGRPEISRLIRTVRLSPTHFNHNMLVLQRCAPHLKVLVLPLSRSENIYVAIDTVLPPLPSLTHVYWTECRSSPPLLSVILRAAPNLRHLSLSSSTILGTNWAPAFQPLPCLKSLSIFQLTTACVHALLRTDLTGLTHLTINHVYLVASVCPAFPALRVLSLNADTKATIRMRIHFPAIFSRCPALHELRYFVHSGNVPPLEGQIAPALACVRLYLGDGIGPLGMMQRNDYVRAHMNLLLGTAFGALKRVVLDGPGWRVGGRMEWAEWAALRERGCTVEASLDSEAGLAWIAPRQ